MTGFVTFGPNAAPKAIVFVVLVLVVPFIVVSPLSSQRIKPLTQAMLYAYMLQIFVPAGVLRHLFILFVKSGLMLDLFVLDLL